MDRWAFATVDMGNGDRPRIRTTIPSVAEEVLDELKALIPTARIGEDWDDYRKLGTRLVTFEKLNGKDRAVRFWIIAYLCEHGWEPISDGELRRRLSDEGGT